MLRRNIRDSYQIFTPEQSVKDAIFEKIQEQRPRGVEMKGRKWRAKGQYGAWTLILIVLCVMLSVGYYFADQYGITDYAMEQYAVLSERVMQYRLELQEKRAAAKNNQDTQDDVANLNVYKDLVDTYVTAIQEDWDKQQCEAADISCMITYMDDPAELGYTLADLDNDGVQELVLTDGKVIYDLYTWQDGQRKHVLSSEEHSSYNITHDGVIIHLTTNGYAGSVYTFYRYSAGYLIVDQSIIYDETRDSKKPWFRGFGDPDNVQSITEVKARQIIASFVPIDILCTPITAYTE